MWRCPCAGHKPAESAADLDEHARETIADIERLTKASGLRTCPNAYTRLPWVVSVARLHAHREKHMLAMVKPRLSAVEVEALNVIDGALSDRTSHEIEQSRKRTQVVTVPGQGND